MKKRLVFSGKESLETNYISTDNGTSTPTTSFTGAFTYCVQYQSVKTTITSDQNGTVYIDFSNDGITAAETITDIVTASVPYFRIFSIENCYFRVRFIAGVLPSSLKIYTVLDKNANPSTQVVATKSSFFTAIYPLGASLTNYYTSINGNVTGTVSPAGTVILCPIYGVFSNAYLQCNNGIGAAGKTRTATFYKNGVAQSISCTLLGGISSQASDTTHTVSVVPWDAVCWIWNDGGGGGGYGGSGIYSISIIFTPS